MEKSCPITKTLTIQESPRSSIKLLIDSIKVFELDPSTIEPLSQESYSSLISHYSSSSKHFIIALVKSRDLENPTHLFSFCFDAYQLNKLLFKVKPNQELISRHDRLSPISASNPLTNLPIIGEVEYFLMKSPEMAEFIGTDYTFTQLSTLRNIFETNALRQEDMKFPLYTGHVDNLSSFALIDSNSLVLLERVIEGHRGSLLSQIRVPFKKAVPFGGLIVLYFMVLWLVLFIAGGKFISGYQGDVDRYSAREIFQIILMPLVSIGIDKIVFELHKTTEEKAFFHAKIFSWVCLGGAIGLSFTTDSLIIEMGCAGMLMGYSIYYQMFSICVFYSNYSHIKLV